MACVLDGLVVWHQRGTEGVVPEGPRERYPGCGPTFLIGGEPIRWLAAWLAQVIGIARLGMGIIR